MAVVRFSPRPWPEGCRTRAPRTPRNPTWAAKKSGSEAHRPAGTARRQVKPATGLCVCSAGPARLLGGTYRLSAILPAPPLMTARRIRLPGQPTCRRAGNGQGGIRTRGTPNEVRRFSKPVHSATLAPVRPLRYHQRGCGWTCVANRPPFWPARNQPDGKSTDPGVRLSRADPGVRPHQPDPWVL